MGANSPAARCAEVGGAPCLAAGKKRGFCRRATGRPVYADLNAASVRREAAASGWALAARASARPRPVGPEAPAAASPGTEATAAGRPAERRESLPLEPSPPEAAG